MPSPYPLTENLPTQTARPMVRNKRRNGFAARNLKKASIYDLLL
jgi:hypothetical protein